MVSSEAVEAVTLSAIEARGNLTTCYTDAVVGIKAVEAVTLRAIGAEAHSRRTASTATRYVLECK